MAASKRREAEQRRAAAVGWLCLHFLCSVFGLAMVPGFEILLLAALAMSAVVLLLVKAPGGRKRLAIALALTASTGFAARKLAYEAHGATPGLFVLVVVVVIASTLVGYDTYLREKAASLHRPIRVSGA